MAGGIVYLDVDDEITSAAARIRARRGRPRRARPAVRLARRDVADQLPAAVARRDAQREAAVDRRRRRRHAGAGGVGRAAGLRVGRRVRVVASRRASASGRWRDRRIGGDEAEPAAPAVDARRAAIAAASPRARPATRGKPLSRRRDRGTPRASPAAAAGRRRCAGRRSPHWLDDPPRRRDPRRARRPPSRAARVVADTPSDDGRRRRPGDRLTRVARAGGAASCRPTLARRRWSIGSRSLASPCVVGGVGAFVFLPSATTSSRRARRAIGPVAAADRRRPCRDRAGRRRPASSPPCLTLDVERRQRSRRLANASRKTTAKGTVRVPEHDFTVDQHDPAGQHRQHAVAGSDSGPTAR